MCFLYFLYFFVTRRAATAATAAAAATAAEEFPAPSSPRSPDVQGVAKPFGQTPHSDNSYNVHIFPQWGRTQLSKALGIM